MLLFTMITVRISNEHMIWMHQEAANTSARLESWMLISEAMSITFNDSWVMKASQKLIIDINTCKWSW